MNSRIYEILDRLRSLEQEDKQLKKELKELLEKETVSATGDTPTPQESTPQYKYVIGRVYPSGRRDGKSAWIEIDIKHADKYLLCMASTRGVITEAGFSRKVAEEELQKYLGTDEDFSTPVKEPEWMPTNFSGYPNKPLYKY